MTTLERPKPSRTTARGAGKPKKPPGTRKRKGESANEVVGQARASTRSKYQPEFVAIARRAAEIGLTDHEIAHIFGVDRTTLWRWCDKHPELTDALKLGKEVPDERVKQALYHRAVGYSYDAEKIVVDPRTGKTTRVQYVEHVPPDTKAAEFWLKNRRPEQWRERHEHTGADGGPLVVELVRFGAGQNIGSHGGGSSTPSAAPA